MLSTQYFSIEKKHNIVHNLSFLISLSGVVCSFYHIVSGKQSDEGKITKIGCQQFTETTNKLFASIEDEKSGEIWIHVAFPIIGTIVPSTNNILCHSF